MANGGQDPNARRLLLYEARALLTRIEMIGPFSLTMPHVPAASISRLALRSIDQHLHDAKESLSRLVRQYLRWLISSDGQNVDPHEAQRRFVMLRMRFNAVLSQIDIFADVVTQRAEHKYGVLLSGLDALADDAIRLSEMNFDPPPIMTYLDRGAGAAIRRARTRLPGGQSNPVAIIRVPRERMVGTGIASSLIHEVGHQGAVQLDLISSLRRSIRQQVKRRPGYGWQWYERWISEILADLWSVARVGIASSIGLLSVISLPRVFVFRVSPDDPHPIPWMRMKISTAIGRALYPHPQWNELARIWESYYPLGGLPPTRQRWFRRLEATVPEFVRHLVNHKPRTLNGKSVGEALVNPVIQPASLESIWQHASKDPQRLKSLAPTVAFAVLGQAKAAGKLSPRREGMVISSLLDHWAVIRSTKTTQRPVSQAKRSRSRQARAAA